MKMFDAGKIRMIGLPYGEKNYDDMLSRFHTIPACYGQTDRQTDGQTVGPSTRVSKNAPEFTAVNSARELG